MSVAARTPFALTPVATEPVLEGRNLGKHFSVRHGRGLFASRALLYAVEDFSVGLSAGTVTALVGESGSGKTTVARLLAKVIAPDHGELFLDGAPAPQGRPRSYTAQVQMVLQDPFASLNPVYRIRHNLVRPLRIHHTATDIEAGVADLLTRVALEPPEQFANKFPHELSGGQRQRVAIARALAVRPRVLLADEPVSMLDVSVRLGLLNLLADLRDREHLAILYVTHDIGSARYLADTIMVMYAGRLVESAPSANSHRQPGPPLHSAPAVGRSRPGPLGTAESGRQRRAAKPDLSAERMPLPSPLPPRHGDLQPGDPARRPGLVRPHRRLLAARRPGGAQGGQRRGWGPAGRRRRPSAGR